MMESYAYPNPKNPRHGTRVNPLGALFSLALGIVIMVLGMGYAVGVHATDPDRLLAAAEPALVQTGILSQEHAERFAQETIGYLTGRRAAWLTEIAMGDMTMTVPEAFAGHMAQVQQWVMKVPYLIPLMIAAFVALVFLTLIGAAGMRSRMFSAHGYLLGAAIPLLLAALCFAWAALDFAGFWKTLHDILIPGGIFAVDEPVMRLFPLAMFQAYLEPIVITFLYVLGIVLLIPVILALLDRMVRRRTQRRQLPYEQQPMEYR